MKHNYEIQLEELKSKSFYTQKDYEIASELYKLNDDPNFHKDVQSVIKNILEILENNNNDRKAL